MLRYLIKSAVMVFVLTGAAQAAQTVRLPDYLCGGTDSLFADGYETGGMFASDASLGSGGAWPGESVRSFAVPGLGQVTYYAYVPPQYDPAQAMPLMLVLHGAAGSPAAAMQAAAAMRDDWENAADAYGFVIIAPVASGNSGGWVPLPDYDKLESAWNDAASVWNIERNRRSLWGFSAGGHVAWDMVLNHDPVSYPTAFHAGTLASLSTSAANSQLACFNSPNSCATLFAALPRKLPVDIHIGISDPNYAGAAADHQRLLNNGWIDGVTVSYNAFVGGHTFVLAHLPQIAQFACGFAVQP